MKIVIDGINVFNNEKDLKVILKCYLYLKELKKS